MSRVFLLDNYDSFTYNLYQYLCELGAEVTVARNDKITPDEIAALQPVHIVISPGPKRPEDAGISIDVIHRFAGQIPILGVCLGHQAIGAAYGAAVVAAGEIMHGKASQISHDGKGVFAGLSNPFDAIRYHSLRHRSGHPAARIDHHRPLRFRRAHGRAPPRSRRGGRAVPPRIDHDRRGS